MAQQWRVHVTVPSLQRIPPCLTESTFDFFLGQIYGGEEAAKKMFTSLGFTWPSNAVIKFQEI